MAHFVCGIQVTPGVLGDEEIEYGWVHFCSASPVKKVGLAAKREGKSGQECKVLKVCGR